uniref:Uncharacterized protein n=1 Tax=Arundo donax TaxID=35708 RepID=A0A0A8Y2B8_ARUDO
MNVLRDNQVKEITNIMLK